LFCLLTKVFAQLGAPFFTFCDTTKNPAGTKAKDLSAMPSMTGTHSSNAPSPQSQRVCMDTLSLSSVFGETQIMSDF